jgi:coenzyme F420-dependent glucose-6-phosphate dehydrogenase
MSTDLAAQRGTVRFAYHASHEQFAPSALVRYACLAEQAGFTAVSSSDHLQPWNAQQGESGFSWAWLGAVMQATALPCGVVCAPGPRYHPVLIAQAAATLAEMFPGRFRLALGSGEALNERVTGEPWPPKAERNARLVECVEVIRALWAGETVTHQGRVRVEAGRLYTRPAVPPPILGAAVTAETARWVGGWADGLLTVGGAPETVRQSLDAFYEGGGAGKPVVLQVALSYARDEAAARQGAHEQWRTNIFPSDVLAELWRPEHFEAIARYVRPEDLHASVRISADPQRHLAWLHQDLDLGVSQINLHNVSREQEAFIEAFGTSVLPALHRR